MRFRRTTGLALAATVLSACGMFSRLRPSKLIKPELTVAVNVAVDANADKPVAFDFVSINDKELARDLAKMTATEWFQKRDQIRQDFPKQSAISVRSWEWVPGQVVPSIQIPMRNAPRLMLVFANYSTPGPHRAAIDGAKPVLLSLGREDIQVQPLAK